MSMEWKGFKQGDVVTHVLTGERMLVLGIRYEEQMGVYRDYVWPLAVIVRTQAHQKVYMDPEELRHYEAESA